ncbi:hypothetical protein [Neptunomonas antarctica]|uniref:hypothetical protein n=1 Tax=Neptunomonas antarctica TaxID=619304 RepID=UPI00117C333C|nr:hypothetical protein [Neptunomonas antarctica]
MKFHIIKAVIVLFGLLSLTSTVAAHEWEVADGGYQICDSEKQYRQLLSYSLYGVGNKPASGCNNAPTGARVTIIDCVESDIILCQFTFHTISGTSISGWASKALLREIPH